MQELSEFKSAGKKKKNTFEVINNAFRNVAYAEKEACFLMQSTLTCDSYMNTAVFCLYLIKLHGIF